MQTEVEIVFYWGGSLVRIEVEIVFYWGGSLVQIEVENVFQEVVFVQNSSDRQSIAFGLRSSDLIH